MRTSTASRVVRLAVSLLLAAGCAHETAESGILPIREIELVEIRPGATLRVRGSGFVPGPVDVAFQGTAAQPGGPPRLWAFTVHASATSDEEIVGLIPDEAVDTLEGTHGRFRGSATVRFPPPPTPGLPSLTGGRDGLSVPMVSEVPASRETRTALDAAAEGFLSCLGLAVGLEEPSAPGDAPRLVVRSLPPQPSAPLDEILPGDRITALDGIPVSSLADLAPNPDAEYVTMTLAETDGGQAYDVHVALRGSRLALPTSETLAVFAVLAVLGLVCYVHFAGLSGRLARLFVFPIAGRRTTAGTPPAASPPAHLRGRDRLVAGAAALLAAGAPIVLYRMGRPWPVIWLWGAAVGLLLLHRLAHAIGDLWAARSGPGTGLVRAFGAVAAAGTAALPITASVALVLWNSAALTAGGAVAAQGALPQDWAALRDPFALLLACLALTRVGAGFAPRQTGWRTAVDALVACAACLVVAVTGFGGWNVGRFEDVAFAGLPAGAWALEAKTAVLVGAVAWYARRRRARHAEPRAAGLLWLAAPPLALASVGLDVFVPPEWIAAVVRPAAVGLLATLALALWLGNRRRTAPAIVEIGIEGG